jgi:hypothetical protein
MLSSSSGKLMVYVSSFASCERRLKHVRAAVEKMAELLKLGFEVVTFDEKFTPIYVYYKNGEEEPIPVYCDKDGKTNAQEVYGALRKMMFVLSFHPKHSALKEIRREVMLFS